MEHAGRINRNFEHYLSNVLIIWIAIAFYNTNRYYVSFLAPETKLILFCMAYAYTALGLYFYVLKPSNKEKESFGTALMMAFRRLAIDAWHYLNSFASNPSHPTPKISQHEKTVLLFALVKVFFLPIMLNFLVGNAYLAVDYLAKWRAGGYALSMDLFNMAIYPLLLSLMIVLDILIFTFGYSVESKRLGNEVRSVEPTLLGWAVAIICYPPFVSFVGKYTYWYADYYAFDFLSVFLTFAAKIAVLALIGIYVWASVALGAKASNLTNRGIVASGPYAYVRHPAYITKNLAWWIAILPLLSIADPVASIGVILSTAFWSFIYFLRAITEERHLIADPDYVAYCKRVKWRFVPGVY